MKVNGRKIALISIPIATAVAFTVAVVCCTCQSKVQKYEKGLFSFQRNDDTSQVIDNAKNLKFKIKKDFYSNWDLQLTTKIHRIEDTNFGVKNEDLSIKYQKISYDASTKDFLYKLTLETKKVVANNFHFYFDVEIKCLNEKQKLVWTDYLRFYSILERKPQ